MLVPCTTVAFAGYAVSESQTGTAWTTSVLESSRSEMSEETALSRESMVSLTSFSEGMFPSERGSDHSVTSVSASTFLSKEAFTRLSLGILPSDVSSDHSVTMHSASTFSASASDVISADARLSEAASSHVSMNARNSGETVPSEVR